MTLIENVMLGAQGQSGERVWPNWIAPRLVAREERACRDKAMDLLAFVKLDRLAREPARILSGGERKLLELARALMADPSLLLLDEPAAGVNPSLLEVILERIVEINRRGVALLVIEHNMDVIVRLCGRVFVMAAGKLLCEGPPDGGRPRSPRHRSLSRRRRGMSGQTPLLIVDNLVAGYEPGLPIVNGASISVAAGEIVAVLGPNGAGKSTLIKAIAGLDSDQRRQRDIRRS